MPGYLADRSAQTRFRNRVAAGGRTGRVVPQYEFNFRVRAHSYRTFPRLLRLLFCRRYDDIAGNIYYGTRLGNVKLQNREFANCANSVSRLFKIIYISRPGNDNPRSFVYLERAIKKVRRAAPRCSNNRELTRKVHRRASVAPFPFKNSPRY